MITLEELKNKWGEKTAPVLPPYDDKSMERLVRTRIRKHTRTSFQYFWASFALQLLVYSMLSHVIVKYWEDSEMVYFSLGGVLLFLPFTVVLMNKFKKMAVLKPSRNENAAASLYEYVLHQQKLLNSFYIFKKWYELALIPLSTAIAIAITFKLYVPGGVDQHWTGAIIVFIVTLLSCAAAISAENRKSFLAPIRQLQHIIEEFKYSDDAG